VIKNNDISNILAIIERYVKVNLHKINNNTIFLKILLL
jgi:hypothetical protein